MEQRLGYFSQWMEFSQMWLDQMEWECEFWPSFLTASGQPKDLHRSAGTRFKPGPAVKQDSTTTL